MKKKKAEHKKISEKDACCIIKHILKAVKYLHSKKLIHRDLKPANILIQDKQNFSRIQLIDFGFCTLCKSPLVKQCGTMKYMAPSLIKRHPYSFEADIWSIGIIMYMLLNNNRHPFFNNSLQKRGFLWRINHKIPLSPDIENMS